MENSLNLDKLKRFITAQESTGPMTCHDCGATSSDKKDFFKHDFFGNTHLYCKDCIGKDCFICFGCNKITCDLNLNVKPKGTNYDEDEDEDDYENISEPIQAIVSNYPDKSENFCKDCYESNRVEYCSQCENLFDTHDINMSQINDEEMLCELCYDEAGYFYCESCGEQYSRDYYGGENDNGNMVCQACYEEEGSEYVYSSDEDIFDHSDFLDIDDEVMEGTTKPYMGVEFEVSVDENLNYAAERIKGSLYDNGRFGLLKEDSSVEHGFEMVTVPMLIDDQKKKWKEHFFDQGHDELLNREEYGHGVHIHLNRPSLPNIGITRLVYLVYGNEENRGLVRFVAERNTGASSWSFKDQKTKDVYEKKKAQGGKFEALSFNRENTIEFRMFQSVVDQNAFFKSMEYVGACQEFCSNITNGLPLAKTFVTWIKARKKQYPHLNEFFVEKQRSGFLSLDMKDHINNNAVAYSNMLRRIANADNSVYYARDTTGTTCFTADGVNWWFISPDNQTSVISGQIPTGNLDYKPVSQLLAAGV